MVVISYIEDKFKGKYRCKAAYDESTNDFPRLKNEKGEPTDIDKSGDDVFVICKHNSLIYHAGGGNLTYFTESIGRIHNIEKTIKEDHPNVYPNIVVHEYDGEGEIDFKYKDSEEIMYLFKPLTSGAGIGAYSKKNLPKAKYDIPEEDNERYKAIISKIPVSAINAMYGEFSNKYKIDLNHARKKVMLDNKSYIHSLGLWDKLINFMSAYSQ